MNRAIDALPPMTRLRCQNPTLALIHGKYATIFPHMDYDERTPPSERTAHKMCLTAGQMCPVTEECYDLGLAIGADHGIWGGRVLVDGKDYYAMNKEETNG